MRKISVITGNRAEYSRLKSVMQAIKDHRNLDLNVIVTASHLLDDFGMTIRDIEEDGFKIDAIANTIVSGENTTAMAKSVGLGIIEITTLLNQFKPDITLILGDRFDALSSAVSAALTNIPVAHIQGGEVTGSIDESIRHSITKLSHLHFASTEASRERIIKMGEPENTVYNVGCPSIDIISSTKKIPKKEICDRFGLDPEEPYLILIQHPVTTECDKVRQQIRETLEALHSLGVQTIMLYPNVDAGSKDMVREIRYFDKDHPENRINKVKHIHFEDFIQLLRYCSCMVGNSSAGIRETCFFGVPDVNIGSRQNMRERGHNVIDVAHDRKKIASAVEKQLSHGRYDPEYVYGRGDSGEKIAKILSDAKFEIQKRIIY